MRYFLLFVLTVGLAACEPSDVVDVEITPPPAVDDAVEGVQRGIDGFNDAVQSFGGNEGDETEGKENTGNEEN